MRRWQGRLGSVLEDCLHPEGLNFAGAPGLHVAVEPILLLGACTAIFVRHYLTKIRRTDAAIDLSAGVSELVK